MKNIVLFNINHNFEKHEELNARFREAVNKKGYNVLELEKNNINEMVEKAGNESDKIFISIDAAEGMSPSFNHLATELYKVYSNDMELKPILIVTSCDDSSNDYFDQCVDSLKNIWTYIDRSIASNDLHFKTIYYSYIKHGFGRINPFEIEENSIEELLKLI